MSINQDVDLLPAYEYSRVPRSLTYKDILDCEKEAWSLIFAAPLKWIFIGVLVPLGGLIGALVPIVGFLLVLFFLFLLFAGVSYCAHKQRTTGVFNFKDFFIVFRSKTVVSKISTANLSVVAMIFSILFFVMMIFCYMIGDVLGVFEILEPFLSYNPYIPSKEQLLTLLAWAIVLAIASCVTFMGSAFVPQLVLLREVDPIKAVASSFEACWKNRLVLMVCFSAHFGLIVVSWLMYGIPFLLLIPMFLVNWFCVFKKIYEVR